MTGVVDGYQVYLACESIDMRKSINGLSEMVQGYFKLDLFSSALFVFCNKGRDKIKLLQWDRNGFWLHYKRLEKGRFQWPGGVGVGTVSISRRELNWLLDGLSLHQRQAHKEVHATLLL